VSLSDSATAGREAPQPSGRTDGQDAAESERSGPERTLRREVLTTVHSVVAPVVVEVQRDLAGAEGAQGTDWASLGRRLEALLTEVGEVVDRLTTSASVRTGSEVREELYAVMHNPVLGRLAACVMALNFHGATSASGAHDAAAAAVATRVGAHLDALSHDLADLRRA
jgi:hypothetical protein